MDKTLLVAPVVAADSAYKSIAARLNHKPTKEECEASSKAHTERYVGQHFYLFKFNRRPFIHRKPFGLTTHTLSSYNMYDSNILAIIEKSLKDGTFVSLEKVTIGEYAKNGAGDIPCCLRNCEYKGDWPPCMKVKSE